MEIIFQILLDDQKGGSNVVRKEFNSDILPTKEVLLEDSAWKEPRKIIEISLNFAENYYLIVLDPDRDKIDIKEKLKMYLCHGWHTLT